MNEKELEGTWVALEPAPGQRRRIEARVRRWLEAKDVSLAAEWLELLKVNPIARIGFAAVAACLMVITAPLSWVALAAL
jgi:hypothetical protein